MPIGNLYGFVNTPLGMVHLAASLIAIVLGTFVLLTTKGTRRHRRFGYAYTITMVIVCGTALALYNLNGRWGPFHYAAVGGLLTLIAGLYPMFRKDWPRERKEVHLWFMYYSVIGLYAAFFSELLVRVPSTPFFGMVGVATGITMAIGTAVILFRIRDWVKPFRSRT